MNIDITDKFILLTVDESRADLVVEAGSIWEIEQAIDIFSDWADSHDFSNTTSLTSAAALDQYGNQYTGIKVKPNVVFEFEDEVYVGSDGFLINLTNTLDYLKRRLEKLKAEADA